MLRTSAPGEIGPRSSERGWILTMKGLVWIDEVLLDASEPREHL